MGNGWNHGFFEEFYFFEGSLSAFCEAGSRASTKSVNQGFFTLEFRLLFLICLEFSGKSMFFFFDGEGIISMIEFYSRWTEDFDHFGTRTIEEFSVMGNYHIASFPGFFEVFFEPFDTREVDEVRWFIEEEKVRF